MTGRPPDAVRRAGLVVAAEGVAGLIWAAVLVIAGIGGGDKRVAFGTAGWFVVIGGAVLAAGWALWTGRRWGRGVAVFVQLLLLPVAWYMAVGSDRPELGVPVGVVALIALVLLFSPSTVRWVTGQDPANSDPANADRADPDTR